jgi:formylmethanofuran dehydrogenase subunit E
MKEKEFLNGLMDMVFEKDFEGNCDNCKKYDTKLYRNKDNGKMLCKNCETTKLKH